MPINQIKPLGAVLEQAGLVSAAQIEIALQEQRQGKKRRIGEILALHGWIEQETADFFAQKWTSLLRQPRQPLGQYFKEAALLNEAQIQAILSEQKQTGEGFGEIAVQRGWLKRSTLEFFVKSLQVPAKTVSPQAKPDLTPERLLRSWRNSRRGEDLSELRDRLLNNHQCNPFWLLDLYKRILQHGEIEANNTPEQRELLKLGLIIEQQGKLRVADPTYEAELDLNWVESELARLRPHRTIKLKLEEKADYPYTVLEEILVWTNHHPTLAQKLYQLVYQSESSIAAGEEARRVEQLVRTYIVNDWERGVAAVHLKEMRDRFLSKDQGTGRLLRQYRQVLEQSVPADYRWEQQELLKLGLLEVRAGELAIYNRIYAEVFNRAWVDRELNRILGVPIQKTIAPEASEGSLAQSARHDVLGARAKRLLILLGVAGIVFAISFVALTVFSKRLETRSLFEAGNDLIAQGDYDGAIAKYNEVLDIDANYYQAWTNRGYALAGLQRYRDTIESCKTATIIEPQATYAWNCLGEALYSLQEYREAIFAFEQASSIDSNDPVFYINKSESLLALGETELALATIKQAIAQLQQQDIEQESVRSELSIALSLQGRIHREQQQYEAALAAYEQAVTYVPQYFPAQRGQALALRALKQYKRAGEKLDELLDSNLTDGQKAETWFYKGLNLCERSQIEAGRAAFREALKLQPNYEAAQRAKSYCQ